MELTAPTFVEPEAVPEQSKQKQDTSSIFEDLLKRTSQNGSVNLPPPLPFPVGAVSSGLGGKRAQVPGPITLPVEAITLNNATTTATPLKRPMLPSAASPVAVDEHSPTKVTLYYAPEELQAPEGPKDQEQTWLLVENSNHYFTSTEGSAEVAQQAIVNEGTPTTEQLVLYNDLVGESAMDAESTRAALDSDEEAVNLQVVDEMGLGANIQPAAVVDAPPVAEPAIDDLLAEPAVPAPAAPADDNGDDEWMHVLDAIGVIGPWRQIMQNVSYVNQVKVKV
jgi:hypothetical protein